MEAGGRFPTGVRELCVDSCSSATTCELDRPNRGAFVCREAYFLCMLRTNRIRFTKVWGGRAEHVQTALLTFAKNKSNI